MQNHYIIYNLITISINRVVIRRKQALSLVFMFLLLLLQMKNFAQKPMAERPGMEIKLAVAESSTISGDMRVSDETGHPLAIYSPNFVVDAAAPELMARQYLTANKDIFGFTPQDLQNLKLHAIRTTVAGTTVRLRQFWHDLPVLGAEITVTIAPDHTVSMVMNGFRYGINLKSAIPVITANKARDLVMVHLKAKGQPVSEEVALCVFQYQQKSGLYFRANLHLEDPMGDWEALVDAKTGSLLKVEDKACYFHEHKLNTSISYPPPTPPVMVNGTGNVFDPDPLSSAMATYGNTGYVDGSDANTTQLTAQLQSKVLLDINFDGTNYKLEGPYAAIQDFEAPNKGLFAQAGSTFNFDRNADAFEAVNTYYHIDASMRYLNVTLGLNIMPYQYTGGVRYDPHGLSGADNSHYLGGTGRLAFGEGGVDDAEDAGVILHELGHGLHDWVTGGGISQVDGLSEGCGDYWTASYNRSKANWTSGQAPYNWTFIWDGHNPFWGGRIVNYAAVYPTGLVSQIHTDGQIWATAMMQVWDAIGKTKADKSFWNGIGMTNSSSNQNDAANAVYLASIGAGCTPAQRQQIHTIFTNRGYTLPAFCPAGNILYVNDNAIGLNDGTSWANAFNNLQFALELAGSCPNFTQIWVAAGTYYPTAPNLYTNGLNVRDRCFQMKNGVAIYGGFNGSEVLLSERDVNTNVTIISGDIGTPGNNGDNCFHVFYNVNVNSTAILDGFTITGGNANSGTTFTFGGGIYNSNSPVTIANCTFLNNYAQLFGGGIYNSNSSTTITNCSFTGNIARYGGGLNNDGSAPILTNCTFTSNSVSANGGGVHSQQGSTATITNCKFTGNTAEYYGGGVNNLSSGTVLANCSFSGNSGSQGGGFYSEAGSPLITNCSFSGNISPDGGGVKIHSGTPTFKNCIIWGNSSALNASATVTYSIVEQASGVYTGMGNLNVNPLFAGSSDLRLLPGSPAINAGTNSGAPATDIRGIARPQQTTADMGAYEMQGFTMAVAGGDNQSARINSNFSTPLSVTVSSANGDPVNGGKVTFTAPGSDASAAIGGNPATISSGTATSGTVTANATAGGPYTVSASAAGVASGVNFSLTNTNCPTSFSVNDAGDAPDANPGDGLATTAGGVTTLRAAIMEANAIAACSPLTINFSITGVIILATALPSLTHPNLTITGPGADQLTVQRSTEAGTPDFRIFTIPSGKTVSISGLTITKGNGQLGAGIRTDGVLSLNNMIITGNHADLSGGGGLWNQQGQCTIDNTIISNNTAGTDAGIVNTLGSLTISNSIISGNIAGSQSGAIKNQDAPVTMTNCAIFGNSSGGIITLATNLNTSSITLINCSVTGENIVAGGNSGAISSQINLKNTILFNAPLSTGGVNPSIVSLGNNLSNSNGEGFLTGAGDILNTNPLFVSSTDLRLLPGSPAINAGTNSGAPATDIRGISRPIQTTADMGAYEMQGFTMTVASGNNQSALISSNFPNPLSVTVSSANGDPVNGGKVTFTAPGSGASATIGGNPVTISSGTATSGTVTANATAGGPYTVSASASGVASGVNFSLTNFNCPTAFTVNDAGDAPDANPGDGIAATSGGVTTLRAAIMEANAITYCSPLSINFSITGDIVLATALPVLNHPNLTITGPGASQLTVRRSSVGGTPNFRIFTISSGKTVVIEKMTVTNGYASDGGAIQNSGNLTVNNATISGSTATGNGGGGIANFSILTLNKCLITGNTSTFAGGGLVQINGGTTTATNCTFTGNTSPEGGAITSQGVSIPSTMNLVNCVLYGNHANNFGAALSNVATGATTTLNMTNVTIANNTGSGQALIIWVNSGSSVANYQNSIFNNPGMINFQKNTAILNSLGYNISSDGTGNLISTGDMPNTDPLLVSSTDLHLTACSPAIDHGSDAANSTTTDPDGNSRKFEAITGGSLIDIGAYEYQSAVSPGIRWYVNDDGPVAGNGTSWGCAFRDLQKAIASSGSGDTIWVAAGTYKPTAGSDRNISFVMKDGVAIYGGFNGTETSLTQRNQISNPTILSGDLGIAGDLYDNSYHVINNNGNGLTITAVLDGFTITGGNANSDAYEFRGGGICNVSSSPTIQNCLFTANHGGYGGGMYNHSSSSVVSNCTFLANTSVLGGGMFNILTGESATSPVVTNCIFSGNSGTSGGGVYSIESRATLMNCTFFGNTAATGSAVYSEDITADLSVAPALTNCILWGSNNLIYNSDCETTINHSIVKGGYPGVSNLALYPVFADTNDVNGPDNLMNTADDGLRMAPGSPAVDAGNNSGVASTDITGVARIQGGTVDMGAYESDLCENPSNGGEIAGNQYFCQTMVPEAFTSVSLASGHTGALQYQWQSSISGSSSGFADIASATGTTYAPGSVEQTTWYKRLSRVGCKADWTGAAESNIIEITIHPSFASGAIETTGETICYNGNPGVIGNVTAASGGDGSISYQWQSSLNATFSDAVDIGSATGTTYDPPSGLTVTTTYRRMAKDGTCNTTFTASAGTWAVTVHPQFTVGSISASQNICYNTAPAELNGVAPTGGNSPYTYQWQRTTINPFDTPPVGFADISGATSLNFEPGTLNQTTYYRQIQSSASGCGTAITDTVTITVEPTPVNGILTKIPDVPSVCFGADLSATFTAGSGGNGTDVVQYRTKDDGTWSGWLPYDQNHSIITNTIDSAQIIIYRDADYCNPAIPDTISWQITSPSIGGAVTGGTQVCYGVNSTVLSLTGQNGAVQRWELSTDNEHWTNIDDSTGTTFTAVNLTQDTWYRALIQSGTCDDVHSVAAQITVLSNLQISGYAKYENNPHTPLNGLKVVLNKLESNIFVKVDSVETNALGFYEFEGLTNATYGLTVKSAHPSGAWQTWSGVNNTDYLLVARHVAGTTLLPVNPPVVMVSASVKAPHPLINSVDANTIRQAAKYPVTGWSYFDIPKWVFSGLDQTARIDTMQLSCANITRDIRGLCAGDVNGTYVPAGGYKIAVETLHATSLQLVNRGTLPITREITFPVRAEQDMELGAITLMLDYDPAMIEITGVEMPDNGGEEPYFVLRPSSSVLDIGWMSLTPVNVVAGQTVLMIHAKVKSTMYDVRSTKYGQAIRFTLNEDPISELADGDGNVLYDAKLSVADAGLEVQGSRLEMEDNVLVYPNPAFESLNLEIETNSDGPVSLTLVNLQGVSVMKTNLGMVAGGWHKAQLNLRELAPGVYFLRVMMGDNTVVKKVVIRSR